MKYNIKKTKLKQLLKQVKTKLKQLVPFNFKGLSKLLLVEKVEVELLGGLWPKKPRGLLRRRHGSDTRPGV